MTQGKWRKNVLLSFCLTWGKYQWSPPLGPYTTKGKWRKNLLPSPNSRKVAVRSTTGSLHDSRKTEEKSTTVSLPDSRKVAVKSTTGSLHDSRKMEEKFPTFIWLKESRGEVHHCWVLTRLKESGWKIYSFTWLEESNGEVHHWVLTRLKENGWKNLLLSLYLTQGK